MLKNSRFLVENLLSSSCSSWSWWLSTTTRLSSFSSRRKSPPPILVDITYEEGSCKFLTANRRIFAISPPIRPNASLLMLMPDLPKELKNNLQRCTVFKEVCIRKRILPPLPEKRREIEGFCNHLKDIQICLPNTHGSQSSASIFRLCGTLDLENWHE